MINGCVYSSLSTSRNTTYETTAYSRKRLPTLLFWGRMFPHFKAISSVKQDSLGVSWQCFHVAVFDPGDVAVNCYSCSVQHCADTFISCFCIADVGFKIGKNTNVKYIVLQVHYRTPMSCTLRLWLFSYCVCLLRHFKTKLAENHFQ